MGAMFRVEPARRTTTVPVMTVAWLAAAWLAGIAASSVFGRGAWPLALAVLAAILIFAVLRRTAALATWAAVVALVFAAGIARFETSRPHTAADAVSHYNDGVAMRIRGVLRDDPEIADMSQRFSVTTRDVQIEGEWKAASGGVLVRTGLFPRYKSGDLLELEGELRSPPQLDGFDYAEYLARKDIGSVMQFPAARAVGHEDDSFLRATILHVRRKLSDALGLALPEPQSSLAQGILLGQKSALPDDIAADLNTTNTSHLVVVSGENVVLVSAFATAVLAWLVGRRRALLLSIAVVAAYAVLIGASPSVLRATIMGVLLIVASLAGRPSSGITSILFAAAIMSGIDPRIDRDLSFQLTFAATLGIVYLASPIREWTIEWFARVLRRDSVPRWLSAWLAEPLAVTLAATIATEPLIAMNFGRVSLVALPANLLVVPAFGIIMLTSVVAAVGGLLPAWRLVFAAPAYYALSYWIALAHWFSAIPGSSASIHHYSALWTGATYAAVTALALGLLRRFGRPLGGRLDGVNSFDLRRVWFSGSIAVMLAVLVAGAGLAFWPSPPARLRVTVLDVGQGDAILIQTPDGKDILVDGGPGRAVLRGLGDELPWRDRSIELMVLTHPQADHMDGLVDVFARYDVRRVIAGPGVQASAGWTAWHNAARDEGVPIETAVQEMALDLGGGVRLDVLGPDSAEAADPKVNNTGAVIRVVWHDVSVLLTADIEARAERALLNDGIDLRSTMLKVGHHGSKTSSSPEFLAAVSPAVAVVSSGKDNPFGHPAPEVVDRLAEYGPTYNTADTGPVHFETDGYRWRIDTGR
jgi:competence protein ComEC